MLGVVGVAAFVAGTACAGWLLRLRLRAVAGTTRRELLAPMSVLVCLQAWISGAALAALAGIEVYGSSAPADEALLVARAALGALVAWLPLALGLFVPVLRNLRGMQPLVFVDLSSALVYSVALVGWVGSGRWQDAM